VAAGTRVDARDVGGRVGSLIWPGGRSDLWVISSELLDDPAHVGVSLPRHDVDIEVRAKPCVGGSVGGPWLQELARLRSAQCATCVPAAFATPVPAGVSSRDGAPLTCAGVTTYKAIKVAGVAPAETVAIFGIGGLGHLALKYARIAGGFTIGVDIEDEKLAMATELGADHVVNARDVDPVEAIQRLGGADVAVALAASPASFDQAYRSLRRGGRLVCVALPADNGSLTLPIFDTVINGKTVIGSIVGTRNDLADVFRLHAAGRTTVISVERKLDEVSEAFADVLAGKVPAPVVFQF